MIIFVNHAEHEIPESKTVSETLALLKYENFTGIAVAVNNHVVPRTQWNNHLLKENDKVTIIRAVQGG
ncbi:MAG: sulfur carrier protein ThiS [Bacteroidia bacterium]|nr:sulfur carrier protein ThiS [Bacteroidia bacterium]